MTDKIKVGILAVLSILFFCYTAYLYNSNYDPEAYPGTLADKGKQIWQDKNCTSCHQIYGLGGYLGPDLTNVYSRRTKDFIISRIQYGTDIMPAYHLDELQLEELIAYLKSLDESGIASPAKLKLNIDGTIER